MVLSILLLVAIVIFISFVGYWLELFIVKFFIKNLNKRYLLTGIFNTVCALTALPKNPNQFWTYLLIGLPVFLLLYWIEQRSEVS